MISLFTGMPGAGKTAAMIRILVDELGDRPLFVHFDEAERVRPTQKLLAETLQIPHTRCHANTWHDELPDGAVLVIDEGQGVWRPRGPATKVPTAIQALETHRHGGIDVFITTQAPRLIDANVRGLVGRHVHLRDTGWFGRWWYEWPETNEGLAWKTCPVKNRYKVPKKVFGLYKSANEHTKPVRGVPRMAYVVGVLFIALAFLGYRIATSLREHTQAPVQASALPVPAEVLGGASVGSQTPSGTRRIDDRVDWVPRVSSRPESAPIYDEVRKIVSMPRITSSICVNADCTCYTQQKTVAEITPDECRTWALRKPFDPYLPDEPPPASAKADKQAPAPSSST